MEWLQALAAELAITLADGTVWLSIGQGLLFGALCLLFGVGVARFVGLLDADAPAGETIGVGLTSGLLVLASWWAAIVSGGRSSFTPVAVAFAVAIGLAALHRWRPAQDEAPPADAAHEPASSDPLGAATSSWLSPVGRSSSSRWHSCTARPSCRARVTASSRWRSWTPPTTPSSGVTWRRPARRRSTRRRASTSSRVSPPRPGTTGARPGWPPRRSAIFGVAPLDARHLIVLPLVVLAAASMTGTLVRRLTGASSTGALHLGLPRLSLPRPDPARRGAALQLVRAVGLAFGITLYGLAAPAVLLAMYGLVVLGARPPTWALAVFAASAVALILPAHVVIAVLGTVGLGSVWAIRIGEIAPVGPAAARDRTRLASDIPRDRRRARGHGRVGLRHRSRRRGQRTLTRRRALQRVVEPDRSRSCCSVPARSWRSRSPGRGPSGLTDGGGPLPGHGRDPGLRRDRLGRQARRLQHLPPLLRRYRRLRDAGCGRRGLVHLASAANCRSVPVAIAVLVLVGTPVVLGLGVDLVVHCRRSVHTDTRRARGDP